MKILLIGAFGYGNLGDDLLRDISLKYFSAIPGLEIRMNRPYPDLHQVDWADSLVLGPGGLLYMNKTAHFDYMKMYVDRAIERKIPFYWMGVGFQKFEGRALTPEIAPLLKNAKLITLRHKQDVKTLLNEARVRTVPYRVYSDIAFSWRPDWRCEFTNLQDNGKKNLGVVLGSSNIKPKLLEFLSRCSLDYNIYLISFSLAGNIVAKKMASKLQLGPPSTFDFQLTSYDATFNLMASMDMILSEKYHGCILAAIAGVRFFTFNRTWKFTCDFQNHMLSLEMLGDMDSNVLSRAPRFDLAAIKNPNGHLEIVANSLPLSTVPPNLLP